MIGAALCLYFFAILLNGLQTLAEETTSSIDATTNSNNENKDTVYTSNIPTSDGTTAISNEPFPSKVATAIPNEPFLSKVATRKADVTPILTKPDNQETSKARRGLEEYDRRTTRNINDYVTERSGNDYLNTVPVARYVQEPVEDVDDIIDGLINRPTWNFRDEEKTSEGEQDRNDLYRRANEDEKTAKRPNPSYFSKLTGGLVVPALKAKQRFSDAWTKTSDGFKNIGSGTYDAAAGAFNFVKDSAAVVLKGK